MPENTSSTDNKGEKRTYGKRRVWRALLIATAALLLLLATFVILSRENDNQDKKTHSIDRRQIGKLQEKDDCRVSVKELAELKVDSGNLDESIALLNYRGTCYWRVGSYEKSLSDFEELKSIYIKNKNKEGIKNAEKWITIVEKYLNSPEPKVAPEKSSAELTPEAYKKINGPETE